MLRLKEALMIDVIKGSVISRLSLRTGVGTLSIPGALLGPVYTGVGDPR